VDDLIITNARIVDGTGDPAFDGDVAVKDGRFTEVGKVTGRATRVIDAEGQLLTARCAGTSRSPRRAGTA